VNQRHHHQCDWPCCRVTDQEWNLAAILYLLQVLTVDVGRQKYLEERQRGVEREKPERFLVSKANAVSNKRTVMVHFKNTFVTNGAMMTPRRFDFVALKTVIKLVNLFDTLLRPHLSFPVSQIKHSPWVNNLFSFIIYVIPPYQVVLDFH
jgi:hypothetical protein